MARNIKTKKIKALSTLATIDGTEQMLVSKDVTDTTSGVTTTTVKKVTEAVLERKIVDKAIEEIGGGGGGGGGGTETSIALDTYSSNTYRRDKKYVINRLKLHDEDYPTDAEAVSGADKMYPESTFSFVSETHRFCNTCCASIRIFSVKDIDSFNDPAKWSNVRIEIRTNNSDGWFTIFAEDISNMRKGYTTVVDKAKFFSGVEMRIHFTGNSQAINSSKTFVEVTEVKNDGAFTDHGEQFTFLVNSGESGLGTTPITIPSDGYISAMGYVHQPNVLNVKVGVNIENDKSNNVYMQCNDGTGWRNLDVVSDEVNTGSYASIKEFNTVFVRSGWQIRFVSAANYDGTYAYGPYTKNNFIVQFESALDSAVNKFPTDVIDPSIAAPKIALSSTYSEKATTVEFNVVDANQRSCHRGCPNDAAVVPSSGTELYHDPVMYTLAQEARRYSPVFVGINNVVAMNEELGKDAKYYVEIANTIDDVVSNESPRTLIYGDTNGEIAFTATNPNGRFTGNYRILISNNVKSMRFSSWAGTLSCAGAANAIGPTTSLIRGTNYTMTARAAQNNPAVNWYRPYIRNLKKVTQFGSNVTTLEDFCFAGCDSLESVAFTGNININFNGYYSFYNCSAIEELTIPDTVSMTGDNAFCFANCSALRTIDLPKHFKFGPSADGSTASYVFVEENNLTTVKMSDIDTQVLPPSSFVNCYCLKEFDLSRFTEIKVNAIYNCGKVSGGAQSTDGTICLDWSNILAHPLPQNFVCRTSASNGMPVNLIKIYNSNLDTTKTYDDVEREATSFATTNFKTTNALKETYPGATSFDRYFLFYVYDETLKEQVRVTVGGQTLGQIGVNI